MLKLIPFFFLYIITCISGCVPQQLVSSQVAKTYYYIRTPGAMPVDDAGVEEAQADTVYISFLPAPAATPPVFTKAWINEKPYAVTATVAPSPVEPFIILPSANRDTLPALTDEIYWQLHFQPMKAAPLPDKYKKHKNYIILEGILNNKPTWQKLDRPVQVQGPEFQ